MKLARHTPQAIRRRIVRTDCGNDGRGEVLYTIATMVSDLGHLEALHRSLRAGGFEGADCEYMHIDNSNGDQICAYSGLNTMLNEAQGRYVILCHQDIRILTDTRHDLDIRLAELEERDPAWALAGNAGGVAAGRLSMRITDPHGANQRVGIFPQRVMSLDENLIIVRKDARVGFSNDLSGFHFYGADICLNADIQGWNAYVIDFHVAHLSAGKKDALFDEMELAFRAKWSRALAPRWMQTTCSLLHLAGNPLGQLAGRLAETPFRKLSRRMPGAAGWSNTKRDEQTG